MRARSDERATTHDGPEMVEHEPKLAASQIVGSSLKL
jgi:hypothetical protein